MISFDNDYSNGAHPKVLQKLVETNELRTQPYGADECCMRAKELIKKACEDDEALHITSTTSESSSSLQEAHRPTPRLSTLCSTNMRA